jgi:hypothetical protein
MFGVAELSIICGYCLCDPVQWIGVTSYMTLINYLKPNFFLMEQAG